MIRSKIAMGFLWALLALALHVVPGVVGPAHAQGSRKDDIVFNSRGIPLAGATVRVCAMPASGQPCTPLALIYSDAALTQALANPTTTDGLGNYFFYAAPGKYEIEISGPAITTKQIPNVILPNDPASPNFSAVSAFSLTLSGNLTVNGSTTVVGNFASGTLNLSNQSTPPGAAGSGTVNLYTKTADKRLYYKDDTGTEVGPLGAGAQTTAINTFTANQNLDSGLHVKGPDPYSDLVRYGGYSNSSPPATTASCTNGSTSVTLAAALDFQDASKFPGANIGNGIVLYQCGAPSGLSTPPTPTVVPFGITGGSTTYSYRYVAEDLQGGLTAASPAGSTTTGAATLGINSVTLTGATWNNTLNGQQVYTCSGNCNVSVGAPITVAGFTNNHFNGQYTIIATNGTNQFTVFSPINPAPLVTSESASATVSLLACNLLSMPSLSVPNTVEGASSDIVMRWWVYRNNTVAFAVQQRDPYYEDCGVNVPSGNIPPYLPSSPGSAVNKYLPTTIVSGGGTTSITVANAAGTTASGQTALHDNSQNLLACMTASRFSTPCYIPAASSFPFNATTVFTSANSGSGHLLIASAVGLSQPWVNRSGAIVFEGVRNNGTSFAFGQSVVISGNGYALPVFLNTILTGGTGSGANPQFGTGINFLNILFQTFSPQGVAFNWDTNSTFGLLMDNVSFNSSGSSSNVNIPPAIIRGVTQSRIGRRGDQNACQAPQIALGPPCIRFTTQSPAQTNSTVAIAGRLAINGFNIQGGGASFQFDSLPWINGGGNPSLITGFGPILIRDGLRELGKGPFVRINAPTPVVMDVREIDDDAPNAAPGNAFFDFAAEGQIPSLNVQDLTTSVGGQVLVSGPALVVNHGFTFFANGTTLSTNGTVGGVTAVGGGSLVTAGAGTGVQASGISTFGYAMPQPNAPTVVVGAHGSCSAGCVAAGTYYYAIAANDVNGKNTIPSPNSAAATTDGTQTITVSWVPVAGQVTTGRIRGTNPTGTGLLVDSIGTGVQGTSYADTSAFFYTISPSQSTSANSSSFSAAGMAASGLIYTNSNFADTIGGTLSANRTQTIPDVSGYIPVTSYVNGAYDNATRANGAIGANWTVQQNGLNIASNQIQGATASQSNSGFWNANSFSPVQFAQATITALNGTSDFPGVTVLASGSASTSTYYDCVENSTTIFMQRVINGGTVGLTSTASSGAVGDILRLEIAPGGALTCFKNGVATLTTMDTQISSGSPGLLISGNVATEKNWSGGNLHPLAQLDTEQDWIRTQHFTQGVAFGTETFTASPRSEQNVFLPGALTSTWTGATWTTDKAVTVTRLQVQAKTAPAGCTTNAIVRLTDGTTPVNVTISAAANDSGSIAQSYAAGASLQVLVQTAAAGCTTSPADANVTVQYRMQ